MLAGIPALWALLAAGQVGDVCGVARRIADALRLIAEDGGGDVGAARFDSALRLSRAVSYCHYTVCGASEEKQK